MGATAKGPEDVLALEGFLPYRLNRLAEVVSREFSRIYRDRYGLTRPEWRLLATLGQYDTMTATEVGRHSSMHKTKVSRAVAALEHRKWLVRTTDVDDRRVERLTLTADGMRVYRDLVPAARAFERRLERAMSADRFAEFHDGLGRLEEFILSTPEGEAENG